MGNCGNCKHWDRWVEDQEKGVCQAIGMCEGNSTIEVRIDDNYGLEVSLVTKKTFGCTLFEEIPAIHN